MALKKPNYPAYADLAGQIDWGKIGFSVAATEDGKPPLSVDVEDATECVRVVAETWLPRDTVDLRLNGLERHVENGVTHGYVDLAGWINADSYTFRDYTGAVVILDWKTTAGELDTRWKDRLVDSWQWRIYAYLTDAKIFIYRGVSRNLKIREVLIRVPESNDREVYEYLEGKRVQYTALKAADLDRWPREMPGACGAFGRECQFWGMCRGEVAPPLGFPNPPARLSPSSLSTFGLCPEKLRLSKVLESRDSTEETEFGTAVHRGLAELYSQVFNVPVSERENVKVKEDV